MGDLSAMVLPFLQMTGAVESLEGVDQTDYNKLVGKKKTAAIKQMIDQAIAKHGQAKPDTDERLREVFRLCDPDGRGMIEKGELIKVCLSNQFAASVLGMPERMRIAKPSDDIEAFFGKLEAMDPSAIT